MRFTDRTGRPGPRDWENGKFPAGKADHPVVGVCWYEAAGLRPLGRQAAPDRRRVAEGRRLARAAQRRRVQPLPLGRHLRPAARQPLGRPAAAGPSRSATSPRGPRPTASTRCTGNVWEWLDDPLDSIPCESPTSPSSPGRPCGGSSAAPSTPISPREATCQFVTGQPELDRRDNIGFRCAVSVDRLRPLPESAWDRPIAIKDSDSDDSLPERATTMPDQERSSMAVTRKRERIPEQLNLPALRRPRLRRAIRAATATPRPR